ncbi:mechanosensitive ion channel family protein [Chitinimonas sp. BJYL2]|uniref:mechanosensitive ion channel family protein n=1 Tax=Chitinimonas sp. BJYL2 TaxID=2976696 RepID=UPI0022B3F1E5|nr:mechanosensitive ion channel domain-containing protein [Chitinimonas sp. BJYL2]
MSAANSTALFDFIEDFQRQGLTEPQLLWQLAVLLLGGVLAWLLAAALSPRLRKAAGDRWRAGSNGVANVLFPMCFWLGVELALAVWHSAHPLTLLRLSASLLSAWVIVRTVAHLLQQSFVQSGWVNRALRPLSALIWLVYALHITGVLPDIKQMLDGIALPLGKQHVSLLTVLNGLVSIAVTLLLAMWLGRLLEQRVMAATTVDISVRVVMTKVARTALVVLGVIVALPLVGIDLTVLSVFGGALGVGLGFGLQKIASNYVSGFIILLDGSVRIGDLVNIDGRQGIISQITSRYVVLKLGDGSEAIIPNEALITSTVLNLSHSDKLLRVVLPVQVAYGSDLERISTILVDLARAQPRVLEEPAPQALIKAFGENGIDVELAIWIADSDQGTVVLRSDLNKQIWSAFRAEGIEIPYPRRDVQFIKAPIDRDQTPAVGSSAR